MLCQNCQQRAANVHYTKVINHNKIELYLCEKCAKESGQIHVEMPLNIHDFFGGFMGFGGPDPYIHALKPQQIFCKKCGMNYEEFQKTGKLGCDQCYELFTDQLAPLIKRLHGSTRHTGKMPAKDSKAMKVSKEIESLKEQLSRAIQSEEYEKAAKLRDKIKSFELQGGSV